MLQFIIKSSDIIAPQPSWYVQGETRYKTILGGLLSILVAMLSILCFMGFGLDLFQRQRPIVYNSRQLILNNALKRNQTDFVLAPMMGGSQSIPNVDRKLKLFIQVIDTNIDRENVTINKRYNLIPCSESTTYMENYNDIQSQLFGNHSKYYCLPQELTDDLSGKFGNANYIVYDFHVAFCMDRNDTDVCDDLTDIQDRLKLFYIHFLYLDHYLDLTDYASPFKEIWTSDLIQVTATARRSEEYYYKIVNINDDIGWILEDFDESQIFQFDSRSSITQGFDGVDILECKVSISNLNDNYVRKYVKLQEIFANTGGFVKFLLMFLSVITEYYSDRCFLNYILNKTLTKDHFFNNLVNFDGRPLSKACVMVNQINKSTDPIRCDYVSELQLKKEYCLANKKLQAKNLLSFCYRKNKKNQLLGNLNELYKKKMDVFTILKYLSRTSLMEQIVFGKEGQDCLKILHYHEMIGNMDRQDRSKVFSKRNYVMLERLKGFLKQKQRSEGVDIWKNFLNKFNIHSDGQISEENKLIQFKVL
jgi:hypothetical protein